MLETFKDGTDYGAGDIAAEAINSGIAFFKIGSLVGADFVTLANFHGGAFEQDFAGCAFHKRQLEGDDNLNAAAAIGCRIEGGYIRIVTKDGATEHGVGGVGVGINVVAGTGNEFTRKGAGQFLRQFIAGGNVGEGGDGDGLNVLGQEIALA